MPPKEKERRRLGPQRNAKKAPKKTSDDWESIKDDDMLTLPPGAAPEEKEEPRDDRWHCPPWYDGDARCLLLGVAFAHARKDGLVLCAYAEEMDGGGASTY
ncbi:PAP fibrillin [Aureococcus anophagefferens]|nr:PAP fibrillin [Aureococcus anophagefferens]